MKNYLLLLSLLVNVISAMNSTDTIRYPGNMNFTERLELECKRAKEANRKKTQLDAQVAQQAQEQRHQISLVDTENIEAYYSDCTAISIAKVMSNKMFNGYLVEYTDKHRRRMRDFINCIKSEQGSQLVRIAINIVS